jgi:hypothetical protein
MRTQRDVIKYFPGLGFMVSAVVWLVMGLVLAAVLSNWIILQPFGLLAVIFLLIGTVRLVFWLKLKKSR